MKTLKRTLFSKRSVEFSLHKSPVLGRFLPCFQCSKSVAESICLFEHPRVYFGKNRIKLSNKSIGRATAPPNRILISKDEIKQKRRQLQIQSSCRLKLFLQVFKEFIDLLFQDFLDFSIDRLFFSHFHLF